MKELATIGYPEGIQTARSHTTDVRQEEFEPYLGRAGVAPVVARGLNAFSSGKASRVQARDED